MTKTTVTPDAEDRGGGVLMASDDEDAITPVTKKHKLTTPIQPPKFKSLFADMEGCDSIDRIEAEQRRKSIALDSDSDDGDGALKNLQSLTWLKTPVGARRKKKVKKNDGGGNGDGLGGFALSGDQESTGISKDVDLDLGRLVPDRETTGGLNPESLQGLFSSEPENVNTTLSKEDVASLLDQNNKMADVTEEIDTPLEMNVSLMTHQKRALAWMSKREVRDKSTPRNHPRGGILADDQGLGKTLSTMALIYHNRPSMEDENSPRQTLIVCPLSMLHQWGEEIHDRTVEGFRPRVLLHHGLGRAKTSMELKRYDIVVTTYSCIVNEFPKMMKGPAGAYFRRKKGPLYRLKWFRVVLDEAQAIKNRRTDLWSAAYELDAERRWCLSGTPIQNSVDDIYSLFIFLRYLICESYKQWNERWKKPMESYRKTTRERIFKQFQTVLGIVLLRRVKSDKIDGKIIVDLPSREEEIVELAFSGEERAFYRALERRTVIQMSKYMLEGNELSSQYMFFLTLLLRLRQTCGHPSMCDWHSRKVLYTDEEMDSVMTKIDNGQCILEQLPNDVKRRLMKEMFSDESLMQECPICISEIEVGEGIVTKCGHFFCCSCDERWFSESDSCAVCRQQLDIATERYPLEAVRKEVFALHRKNLKAKGLLMEVKEEAKKEDGGGDTKNAASKPVDESVKKEAKIEKAVEKMEDVVAAKEEPDEIQVVTPGRTSVEPNNRANALANLDMGMEAPTEAEEKEKFVSSTKIDAIVAELKKIRDEGNDKCLIFSQWTRMLDLLEIPLEDEGIVFERLDGSMQITERMERISNFKKRGDITCILISLHSGGTGLNLTAANHVLFADFWWNPAVEAQAIDRVHRIGQTKPVKIKRFKIINTVEDRILELQARKRELILGALGTEGMQTLGRRRLTMREMGQLFGSVIDNAGATGDRELRSALQTVVMGLRR